jgi:hypothetical protein
MIPVYKMLLLLALTITLKIVEHANKMYIGAPQPNADGSSTTYLVKNLDAGYGILNLHLSLSLGSLGIVLGNLTAEEARTPFFLVIFLIIIFAIVGSIFRGLISKGVPQAMRWSDWDWRNGVMVPNGFGFAALVLSTVYQLW